MSGDKPTKYCIQLAGDTNWKDTDEWGQSHYFVQAMKLKMEKKKLVVGSPLPFFKTTYLLYYNLLIMRLP